MAFNTFIMTSAETTMWKHITSKSGIKQVMEIMIPGVMIFASAIAAHAAEWQKLTQTANHKVSIEMESAQLNTGGKVSVLLQFTPRGELQRRDAATKYGYKNYLQHLEQYEIDCDERSARLEFLDILGWQDKRLTRMPGNTQKETIIPDSVLDRVAALVCPEEENDAEEDDSSDTSVNTMAPDSPSDALFSIELRQRIENAQQRTIAEPGNYIAWVELGNAWYDSDSPKQAIDAYDHALALKPDNSDVLNDQGAMYRQLGDFRHALSNFEKALVVDPGNLESLYNMGHIYAFDLKQTERAMEIWKRYLTLDSESETAEQVRSFIKQYGGAPEVK